MFEGPARGRPMPLELTDDTENARQSGSSGVEASGGNQRTLQRSE
jgi:hypothetical protein